MEKVQRLIIDSNVYDVNDDDLESEVTTYLDSLKMKQSTAHSGKEAIITATENKTGRPITTNTYSEITDKINNINVGTFEVKNLIFESRSEKVDDVQVIIDSKVVRFADWETKIDVGPVAFLHNIIPDKHMHRVPNDDTPLKFAVQVNLDFNNATVDATPLVILMGGQYQKIQLGVALLSNTRILIVNQDPKEYYFDVLDVSNFNYFEIEFNSQNMNNNTLKVYAGARIKDSSKMSGFSPSSKVLLLTTTNVRFRGIFQGGDWYKVECCGSEDSLFNKASFGQTALHLLDYGVMLSDTYETSVIGSTDFIDMEVTG